MCVGCSRALKRPELGERADELQVWRQYCSGLQVCWVQRTVEHKVSGAAAGCSIQRFVITQPQAVAQPYQRHRGASAARHARSCRAPARQPGGAQRQQFMLVNTTAKASPHATSCSSITLRGRYTMLISRTKPSGLPLLPSHWQQGERVQQPCWTPPWQCEGRKECYTV